MPYSECIVLTFCSFRKTAQAVFFANGIKLIPAPGKYFMPVSLVANIPNQLIIRRVENIVKRYGKFHHAEACRKMPAMHAYHIHDILTKFVRYLVQLGTVQFF